jgi:hypothetical protein
MTVIPATPSRVAMIQSDSESLTPRGVERYPVAIIASSRGTTTR